MKRRDTVTVYQGGDGDWWWHRRDARNGQIIATSGEGYVRRSWCVSMARRINRRARIKVTE